MNEKTLRRGRLVGCIIALGITYETLADDWYAAAKISGGYATTDDITDKGSIGTGLPINGIIDGEIVEDDFDDYVYGLGVSIGRRMNYWALEAELIWRYRSDWDLTVPTPAIQTITNIFTNIETTTVMVNVIRRSPINEHWSWEAGAGVGIAHNILESDYIEREVPGVTPELTFEDTSKSNEFTWNLLLGVTRDLGGPWTINARYRYIDFGDLEAGPYPMRNSRVFGTWSSHEIQLSIEREF
ncbi:MAG: outer membrane beta-barrel protein [Gammaproteobacteria bacterium]|nr:outer membrane beta-barrel protein [Gammaproteobacteria bacterium]MCZ6855926.1 outer membrane beta-barrel protein [Gammaproteobacteria bacterium]